MTKCELLPGTTVHEACLMIKNRADLHQEPYYCDFNDLMLIANPGDSVETIKMPFTLRQQENARKYKEKAALDKLKRDAKIAEMTGEGMVIKTTPPEGMVLGTRGTFAGIRLLTVEQLRSLPIGTQVVSIMNEPAIVGVDYLDDDTRGGYTAWGFFCP